MRAEKPMSPEHSSMRRYGRPSLSSTASALRVMRSCSASLSAGRAIDTSSTFSNWCWRIIPRTSRPPLPASERKHIECAVMRSGRRSASTMASRTMLVSEISEVEMR